MTNNSVVFLPSVGKRYGVGNFMRCLTVSLALPETIGTTFCVRDIPYFRTVLRTNKINWANLDNLEEILKHASVVLVDYQGPVKEFPFSEELKNYAPQAKVIAMDYFYRDNEHIDAMINLCDYHLSNWPEGRPVCDYYEGLQYAVIRDVFKCFRAEEPCLRGDVKKVLVTFGGEDLKGWTLESVRWLEQNAHDRLRVNIISGPFYSEMDKLNIIINSDPRHLYSIHKNVSNIEEYMHDADIIFSNAGTTIMEAAFLGKPVIALPQHDVERIFCSYFVKAGYLCGGLETAVMKLQGEPIKSIFKDHNLRYGMARKGLDLIDGQGAKRIADIILNYL